MQPDVNYLHHQISLLNQLVCLGVFFSITIHQIKYESLPTKMVTAKLKTWLIL